MILFSKNSALIHSNHHPNNPGGIEYVVRMILELFEENSIDTICFFGSKQNIIEDHYGSKSIFIGRKIIAKIAGASFLSFGNVTLLFKAFKSKVLIFQEPYPSLWPAMFIIRRILKIPTILLVHANPVSTPHIMKAYSFFRGITFKGAICVTTSPNLLSQVGGDNFVKNLVIPLCVPLKSASYSKLLDLPERYVLYIGRLGNYKGLEYLIESASMLPNIFFIIAGDGPLSTFILNFIKLKSLKNIIFLNRFILESEKIELIDRSEFVVFPSTSENEAFGLVQLEAMRARKPLINTWLNSGVNYVAPNDICAITVEKCNSIALASAITQLWSDGDLRNKLGKLGLIRFEQLFTQTQFIDSWLDLVRPIVKGN